MHNHYLYVVSLTQEHCTEVLGVYDADYVTLDAILDHYELKYDNAQSYTDNENGFIDVVDEHGMLAYCIEVNKTSALIANK